MIDDMIVKLFHIPSVHGTRRFSLAAKYKGAAAMISRGSSVLSLFALIPLNFALLAFTLRTGLDQREVIATSAVVESPGGTTTHLRLSFSSLPTSLPFFLFTLDINYVSEIIVIY
jgi:hypothetical protein